MESRSERRTDRGAAIAAHRPHERLRLAGLPDLLNDLPGYSFDVEEYLCAFPFAHRLEERLAEFLARISVRRAGANCEADILKALETVLADTVPAYRSLSRIERLAQAPLIDRTIVQTSPEQFVNIQYADEVVWSNTTFGSTGSPLRIFYSSEFYFEELYLTLPKIAARAGLHGTVDRPTYAVHVTDSRDEKVLVSPLPGGAVYLRSIIDQMRDASFQRLYSILERWRPAILTARPEILELIGQYHLKAAYSPFLVVSSGSYLDDDRRSRFEHIFKCPVVNAYGLAEFGVVASQCGSGDGLHLDEGSVLPEFLPGSAAGRAELVLSSVRNQTMPLIRYRTSDRADLVAGSCECGSGSSRIVLSSGRHVPCFRMPSGRLISPTCFNDIPIRFPIGDYQLLQTGERTLRLAIRHLGQTTFSETAEQLRRHIAGTLGEALDVDVVPFARDEGTEFQRYRTMLDTDG